MRMALMITSCLTPTGAIASLLLQGDLEVILGTGAAPGHTLSMLTYTAIPMPFNAFLKDDGTLVICGC